MAEDSSTHPAPVTDAIAVIVDCNCFLQVRDLKDVAWRDLFPGVRRVEIMVTPSVITELDKKKVDGKDRIRNRARAANRLIDAASEADPMRSVLREDGMTVALNLPDIPPTDWGRHGGLDPTRPDDQLVAQALDLVTDLPKALLSHDSGPRLAARRSGLTAKNVPETWLLPDPVDDDRRQMQKLQRENERLRARHPVIVAGWGKEEAPLEKLTIDRLILPPLTEERIAAAVACCRAKWPTATATLKVGRGFFIGEDDTSGRFGQDDYERYVARWRGWAESLPGFFEGLHGLIAGGTRFAGMGLWFENAGSATAERLTIDFEASDGWQVSAGRKEMDQIARLPVTLPARPLTPFQQDRRDRARKADDVSRQFRHLAGPSTQQRNPTDFHWIERPGRQSTHGVYGCDEFRAKRRNEDVIWLRPPADPPADGTLRVDIHGSNLDEPLEMEIALSVTDRETDWSDDAVVAALDPAIAEIVASAMPTRS